MKSLQFREQAEDDLHAILDYYTQVAPGSVDAIQRDIFGAIELVRDYPRIAERIEGRQLRRIVTKRYKFKIAYADEAECITVFGIFRYQDRKA